MTSPARSSLDTMYLYLNNLEYESEAAKFLRSYAYLMKNLSSIKKIRYWL